MMTIWDVIRTAYLVEVDLMHCKSAQRGRGIKGYMRPFRRLGHTGQHYYCYT